MAAIDAAQWARLGPHLDELLTLPPHERQHRLDAMAANDPQQAAALRELLGAGDRASRDGFMGGVAEQALLAEAAQAGERLGAWTLVEVIGQGGMGSVWRARRNDGRFEGEAAIKLLSGGRFDDAARERFRREGGLLARLRHRGIAQLLDAGISASGQPYLVLELVQGQRIDAWCQAHELGRRKRLELFLQVLQAVAAAHGQLVIHRDLKPSNILVTDDGQVKLLDFGIARLLGDDAGPHLTREGAVALTPEYAAPEQFGGGVLGITTDVYALGVLLFELVTGRLPYRLESLSLAAQARAVVEAKIPKPSEVAPDKAQARALRGDIDTIVLKALAAEPERRYASATALAEDIERHLQARPIVARPDRLGYRLAKLWQRRRWTLVASAVALSALLLSVGITLSESQRARAEAQRAEATKRFLMSLFDNSVTLGSADAPPWTVTGKQLLERGTQRLLKDYAEPSVLRLELLQTLGGLNAELGLLDTAREMTDEAVRLALRLHGENDPNYGSALLSAAEVRVSRSDNDGALDLGNRAVKVLRQARPLPRAELGQAETLLGNALYQVGRYDESRAHLQAALDVLTGDETATLHARARANFYQARNFEATGRPAEAEPLYVQGIADSERANGPHSYQMAFGRANYGDLLRQLGRLDEAEQQIRQGLEGYRATLGPQHLSVASAQYDLARVMAAQGRRHEADAMFMQAQKLSDEAAGPLNPRLGANIALIHGELLIEMGLFARGAALFEALLKLWPAETPLRARRIPRLGLDYARALILDGELDKAGLLVDEAAQALALHPADDAGVGTSRGRLLARQADLLRARGDLAGARALLEEGLRHPPVAPQGDLGAVLALLDAYARSAPTTPQALSALQRFAGQGDAAAFGRRNAEDRANMDLAVGRLLEAAGDTAGAQARLAAAVAQRERIDAPDSPWLAEAQLALAECLLERGQAPSARPLLASARRIVALHPRAAEMAARLRALQARLP